MDIIHFLEVCQSGIYIALLRISRMYGLHVAIVRILEVDNIHVDLFERMVGFSSRNSADSHVRCRIHLV
jgi:hypothetical protein